MVALFLQFLFMFNSSRGKIVAGVLSSHVEFIFHIHCFVLRRRLCAEGKINTPFTITIPLLGIFSHNPYICFGLAVSSKAFSPYNSSPLFICLFLGPMLLSLYQACNFVFFCSKSGCWSIDVYICNSIARHKITPNLVLAICSVEGSSHIFA